MKQNIEFSQQILDFHRNIQWFFFKNNFKIIFAHIQINLFEILSNPWVLLLSYWVFSPWVFFHNVEFLSLLYLGRQLRFRMSVRSPIMILKPELKPFMFVTFSHICSKGVFLRDLVLNQVMGRFSCQFGILLIRTSIWLWWMRSGSCSELRAMDINSYNINQSFRQRKITLSVVSLKYHPLQIEGVDISVSNIANY